MTEKTVTLPELIFIVGTQAMLGAGVALLISQRMSAKKRRAADTILAAIGLITTIPTLMTVFGKK